MPRHPPGRVERVDRVSGRGSPALAGSLPYPHHLREGKRTGKRTKRAGWQTGRGAALLLFAGRSVARCGDGFAQNWTGWPPFLSSWLLVRWWRSGERVAMVWTVRTADGTEERRGTGEDGGGILRPGSLSSCSVCLFALPFPHHLKEGKRTRRAEWQTVEALSFLFRLLLFFLYI